MKVEKNKAKELAQELAGNQWYFYNADGVLAKLREFEKDILKERATTQGTPEGAKHVQD